MYGSAAPSIPDAAADREGEASVANSSPQRESGCVCYGICECKPLRQGIPPDSWSEPHGLEGGRLRVAGRPSVTSLPASLNTANALYVHRAQHYSTIAMTRAYKRYPSPGGFESSEGLLTGKLRR